MLALEFAVIIVIALIGLGVFYLLFSRVEESADAVIQKKPASPKVVKKAPEVKKPTKKELKAQRELDDLVAADLARATTGMHADSRISKITTLDEYKNTKKENAEKKNPQVAGAKAFSPTQIAVDREQGFTVVKKEEPRKKSASPVAAAPSSKDNLDKKLANFFRSNESKKKKHDDEGPTKDGGRVTIKKDITTTRTW